MPKMEQINKKTILQKDIGPLQQYKSKITSGKSGKIYKCETRLVSSILLQCTKFLITTQFSAQCTMWMLQNSERVTYL